MTELKIPMDFEIPDNHVIVIFGATGDLARRKILPGLFHLATAGLLPERYRIIGSSRFATAMTDDEFRSYAKEAVKNFTNLKAEGEHWTEFEHALSFAPAEPGHAEDLTAAVKLAEAEIGGDVRRLLHLAIPPDAVPAMIAMLGESGLNENARVICEKPFGTDLASARQLNDTILANFEEMQVFRIDHFLGKE